MSNQFNQPVQSNTNHLVVDEILDAKQVQALLASAAKPTVQQKNIDTHFSESSDSKNSDEISSRLENESSECEESVKNVEPIKSTKLKPAIKKKVDFKLDEPKPSKKTTTKETININEPKDANTKLDLTKLSQDMLPIIQKRITELLKLKNQYLSEGNREMVNQIDNEKEQLISAVRSFKDECDKEAKENENKLNGLSMTSSKRPNEEDNVEYLDLKFDPTNNYNDLKNIIIKFKSEDKITDITLVDYYLPFNENNITRFNNKFVVYFNNNITRITIPPGKYDIQAVLDYIKSKATFLDFSINDQKIITIKNTMDMKFDLMLEGDTIFPFLGFIGKMDSCKEKLFYSASVPYNNTANRKILFNLSGSTMEPMTMEFDKNVTINKSLKKSRAGVIIKQITLHFSDSLNQCYDFMMPFKMCFKITYLKKN
jgi:hypothetical protein